MRLGWSALVCSVIGCGPILGTPNAGAETTSTGGEVATTSTTASPPASTTSTSTSVSTSTEDAASSDGAQFIAEPDGGSSECDLWIDDCPRGEKCMPWANDGGSSWNATRCAPIADDPRAPGDPCTVEGSGVSGIDDCEARSMCWNVEAKTNVGVCVAFCSGSEAEPTCESACEVCSISGEGFPILCLPICDLLLQNCDDGEGCYAIDGLISCAPDTSGMAGAAGDPCESLTDCNPGLFCANPSAVPGCESEGCCALLCDASVEDTCDEFVPGTACIPWQAGGGEPQACLAGTISACLVPP